MIKIIFIPVVIIVILSYHNQEACIEKDLPPPRYGNYSLEIRATDKGLQPNSASAVYNVYLHHLRGRLYVIMHCQLQVCVTDFNDHPPKFVSPPKNFTIRVPEDEQVRC